MGFVMKRRCVRPTRGVCMEAFINQFGYVAVAG